MKKETSLEQLKEQIIKCETRIAASKDSINTLKRMKALFDELKMLVESEDGRLEYLDEVRSKAEELNELAIAENYTEYIKLSDKMLSLIRIWQTIQEENR